jgi:LPS-assembly lipoprotein
MSKINLLAIILISSLLSACGFHVPKNSAPINASVTSNTNNLFTTEFKKHLNTNAMPSLQLEIGNEIQANQTAAYKKNGDSSSYTLTLSVPIKVLRGQKVLLSKNLTANITVSKLSALHSKSQADKLQIKHSFTQLRKTLAAKLLKILQHLNAN